MRTAELPVPDLLRRFSAAPHCANGNIQDIAVTLQTNDLDLVSALVAIGESTTIVDRKPSLFVKLIRDYDSTSESPDATVLSAWPLTTLRVGGGTALTLDRERREILGFIAASVSADRVVHELLPILLEYLDDQQHPASHNCAEDGR
jgi:hypothetical protein